MVTQKQFEAISSKYHWPVYIKRTIVNLVTARKSYILTFKGNEQFEARYSQKALIKLLSNLTPYRKEKGK